jgi:hypothetical protein
MADPSALPEVYSSGLAGEFEIYANHRMIWIDCSIRFTEADDEIGLRNMIAHMGEVQAAIEELRSALRERLATKEGTQE